MLIGGQTWIFSNKPAILSTGVVGGPFEGNGLIANDFDKLYGDLWMGQDSYEKAQCKLIEDAVEITLNKKGMTDDNVQFFIAGDLVNQLTPSSFAARTNQIPYIGIFGACSTAAEGLALGAFFVNYNGANYVLTGSSSHNAVSEKQYRYPTEYGSQKPPTAQWSTTASGFGLLGKADANQGKQPRITSATIGKINDLGLTDPFNMGAAMAPAAVDTITRHLQDMQLTPDYYDLIVTGDLAKVGRSIALELFEEQGVDISEKQFQDCGLMIYDPSQPVQAGASGSGCSAAVLYGHLLKQMKQEKYKRILFVATGALLSPLSYQQKETIPCIAHAVAIEFL